MTLIKCPNCNNNISDQAKKCPKCGFELRKKQKQEKIDKIKDKAKKDLNKSTNKLNEWKLAIKKLVSEYKYEIKTICMILFCIVLFILIIFFFFFANSSNTSEDAKTTTIITTTGPITDNEENAGYEEEDQNEITDDLIKDEENIPTTSKVTKNTTTKKTTSKKTTAGSKSWSSWVDELPKNVSSKNYDIETRKEYRYRTKETKTSSSSKLSGWTYDKKEETYSSWSSNKTTDKKVTNSDTIKVVNSQVYHVYYHYKSYYDGINNADSIWVNSSSKYCEFETVWDMPAQNVADKGGKQMYGWIDGCGDGVKGWFKKKTYTKYTYQERTKSITYYFYKYGNWSSWSTSKKSATDTIQVETRTVYRYKLK